LKESAPLGDHLAYCSKQPSVMPDMPHIPLHGTVSLPALQQNQPPVPELPNGEAGMRQESIVIGH
jgi:hypothetical protein